MIMLANLALKIYIMLMKRIIAAILLILFIFSCRKDTDINNPVISTTIVPYKFFIEKISGNNFTVNVMVPTGSSPHNYEPTAKQMIKISRSDLYFKSGYIDFELGFMDKISSINPKLKVIDTSKGIDLIIGLLDEHDEGNKKPGEKKTGVDPHVWMSCINVKIILSNIVNALIEFDPDKANIYKKNYELFVEEIDEIHARLSSALKNAVKKEFIVYHPAWAYFARDYNLDQISIEIEGKDPSPAVLRKIIDKAKKDNIKIIFIQKEFDKKHAQTIAEEINGTVVQISVLEENWLFAMNNILIEMLKALK